KHGRHHTTKHRLLTTLPITADQLYCQWRCSRGTNPPPSNDHGALATLHGGILRLKTPPWCHTWALLLCLGSLRHRDTALTHRHRLGTSWGLNKPPQKARGWFHRETHRNGVCKKPQVHSGQSGFQTKTNPRTSVGSNNVLAFLSIVSIKRPLRFHP